MQRQPHRRVWLDISLSTLRENYRKIAAAVAPCAVIGVIKADAYGLGVRPIASVLKEAGCAGFGVAELEEGLALGDSGLPVQILGTILPEELPAAVEGGIVLPVTDLATAGLISKEAQRQGRRARCQILVDTGMGRLGIVVSDAVAAIRQCMAHPHIEYEGVYSHFPSAYREKSDYTNRQIDTFLALLATLEQAGITFRWRHMANSEAINNFPRACRPPFNAVRVGIDLHGSFTPEGRRALALEAVLTLKTRLAAVRTLARGTHIGYGCTYRLARASRVGTIPVGYADGFPLALSNRGHVLIRNRPCEVIGRVSMDYTTVLLDQVPDAACGDEVICLGGGGPSSVAVEDWARLKGTHAYDIICAFGSRVERCYVEQ